MLRAAGQAERNVELAREEVERLKGQLTAISAHSSTGAFSHTGRPDSTHGIDRHALIHVPNFSSEYLSFSTSQHVCLRVTPHNQTWGHLQRRTQSF